MGTLPKDGHRYIWQHILDCKTCASAFAKMNDMMAKLSLLLPPAEPPPLLREELCHSLGEINRFSDILHFLSEQLDLPAMQVESMLASLEDPLPWQPTHTSGISEQYVHLRRHTQFLKIDAGCKFKLTQAMFHTQHLIFLVLQGTCRNYEGKTYCQGDSIEYNDYHVLFGASLIILVYEAVNAKTSLVA